MKALCNLNLEFWPFDKQVCTFTLGVWGQSDKVSLKNMVDESGVTDFSTTGIEKAQWVLEELTLHEQAENDLHPYFEDKYYSDESEQDDADDDDIEMKNTALEFKVKLRRSNGIYTWTVFAPLYVVLIFIAASFWMETNQSYRLFFGLICLTTNFIVLMSFFSQFPGEVSKTPHIISMYSNALILSTFSILTTIVVMLTSECKSESAPPPIILTFLSYLPDIVTNMHRVHRYPEMVRRRAIFSGNDHRLLENDSAEQSGSNDCSEEPKEAKQNVWADVANAIDLLAFFSMLIFTIIVFSF
ncbi:acetylcholine receptor subunit beta-like 2 [Neocloeon triangulifer]|uniref:acetylcholine receptor subunit beta-like 2 n=1 Tax=Neocloeon triangulifer TaxID=2078957 RepID=UPI00286F4898|nr:acetylcholine receptor subunit beta-like 2 [Neocloeon triangulifer]